MPVDMKGVDQEKCRRRNRASALRFGVETASLTLAQDHPMPEGAKPDFVRGSIPSSPEGALKLINALQPAGAKPLTVDDVYILPVMQAANTNFIEDRYMTLGSRTLRNIQRDAELGFAFMNAHRTGAMSTPSEQPFGKTYAGRYERFPAGVKPAGLAAGASQSPYQKPFERTQLGVYMLKGVYPNGTGGPSTDDMYRQIVGGVTSDVSMGLNGGDKMCDVCGYELRTESCNHVPATTHNVSKEQSRIQSARGIPKGRASYTLDDAHSGEVSGVYDGAIPGAGFSKALEYFNMGALDPRSIQDLMQAYSSLISEGDFGMPKRFDASAMLQDLTQDDDVEDDDTQVDDTPDDATPDPAPAPAPAPAPTPTPTPAPPAPTPPSTSSTSGFTATVVQPSGSNPGDVQFTSAREVKLAKQNAELLARLDEIEGNQRANLAAQAVGEFLSDGHLFEAGQPVAEALARWLADEDQDGLQREYVTALGTPKRATRLGMLREVFNEVPQHDLYSDHELTKLPEGAILLRAVDDSSEDKDILAAKEDAQRVIVLSRRTRSARRNGNGSHEPD